MPYRLAMGHYSCLPDGALQNQSHVTNMLARWGITALSRHQDILPEYTYKCKCFLQQLCDYSKTLFRNLFVIFFRKPYQIGMYLLYNRLLWKGVCEMQVLILLMISSGALLMVVNIARFIKFIRGSRDVLSSGVRTDQIWEGISLILLIFFLVGYITVALTKSADLMLAGILFGGSIFVAIILTLIFRLVTTVKENCLNIAETLISVVDARDPNLRGHSQYVQNVTMLLYQYLPAHMRVGINPLSLKFAALMHDIGKLGIPEEILNKPAPLTDDEWKIMRNHPRIGTQILEPLNSFREILPWIEYHHERLDGNGYYKIPPEELNTATRMIALADTYCAITMRRSYKNPRTYEDAVSVFKKVSGTQLDPVLIDIFLTIPKEALRACVPASVEV